VTTNAGGIPDIVTDGENGLMVECGNCDALARSALRLFEEDGLASKIACKAHEQSRRYAWAAVRDGWLKVYREATVGGEARQEVSMQEAGRGEEKAVS